MTEPVIRVAIDGPAGVGKTTAARALARRLGYLYVDTGAMYRALALKAQRTGVPVDDPAAAGRLASGARIELFSGEDGRSRVLLDGEDVTQAIRTPGVSDGASRISVHGGVRERMVALQRAQAAGRSVVMEGRDIGTRVLPDAEVKLFLTATPEERARRRFVEMSARGETARESEVLDSIRERDLRDSGRDVDPLRPAEDAVVIDCTLLTPEGQVEALLGAVDRARRLCAPGGAAEETGPELR